MTATKTEKKPEGLALLREPFAAHQISKLPKVTCGDCSKRQCSKHDKKKCSTCGSFITTAHVDLDFVGHAALTDRLLDADPNWNWEPVATDERGLPIYDGVGGMWIRLTVCGVTRLGYGDAQGKSGPNAVKEIIGDALRNAAMRFGAALDLWHKGDLHADDDTAAAAEHKQLVNKTLSDDKKAERSGGIPPEEDPWAGPDEVAKPGSEGTVTELGAEIEAAPTVEALRDVYRRVVDLRTAGELTKAQAAGLLDACTARGDVLKGAAA